MDSRFLLHRLNTPIRASCTEHDAVPAEAQRKPDGNAPKTWPCFAGSPQTFPALMKLRAPCAGNRADRLVPPM